MKLTETEKAAVRPIFLGTADKRPCKDCGGVHETQCPRVKRKVFHPNGNLTEVEYWPPGWEAHYADVIIWPEDAFDED